MSKRVMDLINKKNLNDFALIDLIISEKFSDLIDRIEKLEKTTDDLRKELLIYKCNGPVKFDIAEDLMGTRPKKIRFDTVIDPATNFYDDSFCSVDDSISSINLSLDETPNVYKASVKYPAEKSTAQIVNKNKRNTVLLPIKPPKEKQKLRLVYINGKKPQAGSSETITTSRGINSNSSSSSLSLSASPPPSIVSIMTSNSTSSVNSKVKLNYKNFEIFDEFLNKQKKMKFNMSAFMNRLNSNDVYYINPYFHKYPKGCKVPKHKHFKKYIYDTDFLMQFQPVIKAVAVDEEWKIKISNLVQL